MKKVLKWLKHADYRHYICMATVVASVCCSVFVFRNAYYRLRESAVDVANSVVYYVKVVIYGKNGGKVTVTEYSKLPLVLPFDLPTTWEEFTSRWNAYWQLWTSKANVRAYVDYLVDRLVDVCYIVLYALPVFALLLLIGSVFADETNNDYNKDSRMLKGWKWLCARTFSPLKKWALDLFAFFRAHRIYGKLLIYIWLYNFNAASVALEFLAYYLYFVASFNLRSLYVQVLKLIVDFVVPASFLPGIVWFIIGFIIFDKIRRSIGYARLNNFEMRNRGFINERPILTLVCGTMGKKKTTMITDMALSQEIMFRDTAFEKMLAADMKFPYFPWINLELQLKRAIERHEVFNLATCRQFVATYRYYFELSLQLDVTSAKALRRQLKKRNGYRCSNFMFDYDYVRYGTLYDDGLQVVDIWKVLTDYVQLYFIYVMESSLIVSNYSIRTDNVQFDMGNLPLWDNELFKRSSCSIEECSRYSHVLDFDMLRLGRKVVEDNAYANAFEFGVVLVTEIGKERGNTLELKEKKKNDDEANQKNDLFNSWLKMCRHSATVDNFPFIKIISDEQRPSSWGADAVDLCEIVYIRDSGETRLAMPFFNLGSLVFDWETEKFKGKYVDYRYRRGDNSLPMYLFKGLSTKLNDYKTRIYNTFGFCKMDVDVESGTRDGELMPRNYYLMFKKIYSRRFATDCYSDFYMQKALKSLVGLEDLPCYASVRATVEEFLRQNSYFMADLLIGLLGKVQ